MKPIILCLATAMTLAIALPSAFADDDDNETECHKKIIKDLCSSSDVEGEYRWTADGVVSRLYVVCQGLTEIMVAIKSGSLNSDPNVYAVNWALEHTAIDGDDTISFATTDLSEDAGKTSDGKTLWHAILQLSIKSLFNGTAEGTLIRRASLPVRIKAKRMTALPNIMSQNTRQSTRSTELNPSCPTPKTTTEVPASKYSGVYVLQEPNVAEIKRMFNAVKVKMPAYLVIAIAGGIQRVDFQDSSGNLGIFLFWGLSTKVRKNEPDLLREDIIYASNGIDDLSSGNTPIIQIRGRFVSENELQFWYFNSVTGLLGTFRAIRAENLTLPTQIISNSSKPSRGQR
jgi:hypothetical protein